MDYALDCSISVRLFNNRFCTYTKVDVHAAVYQ